MICNYLIEDGYRKTCKIKGLLPPTLTELRLYCYRISCDCPTYKKFIQHSANQRLDLIDEKKSEKNNALNIKPDAENRLY
ncbi:MAG: hypothetical protein WC860_05895 [Candidatus Margulisiibacteriota bacterium]|jgi:hypothetical protein